MNSSGLNHLTLEEFGLSSKVCKKLRQSNVITVEDLIKLNELDLMSIPSLGPDSIREIKQILKENDLNLKFEGSGTPIEELELPTQSYHALKRNGINFIEEVDQKSDQELLEIWGFSANSLAEVRKKNKN